MLFIEFCLRDSFDLSVNLLEFFLGLWVSVAAVAAVVCYGISWLYINYQALIVEKCIV